MQINLSTRHGRLSSQTQEKISEKLTKLSRLYERLTAVQVIIELEHPDAPSVEIRVSAERAEDFVATDRSSSLMASMDGAIHKLEQQLRRHKEKLKGHRAPGRRQHEVSEGLEIEAE